MTPEDPTSPRSGNEPTAPQPPVGGPPPPPTPPAPPGTSRPLWLVSVLLTVAVLAVAGVATAAVLKLSAGGPRPDEVVPGNALSFAALDLDPSAGQKVDAVRFLRQFPALRDKVGGDDLRRPLVQAVLDSGECSSSVSYARDVAPWLGQRLGIALLPPAKGGDQPQVMGALQVSDEDAARAGLRKLDDECGGGRSAVAFVDGYALMAETQKAADRFAAAAQRSPLAEHPGYVADMEQLGETGVSSGWMDMDRLAKALRQASPAATAGIGSAGMSGRFTYALRFEGDDLELVAKGTGMKGVRPMSGPGSVDLARLPATTAVAVGVANGEEQVPYGWRQATSQLEGTPMAAQFDQFVAQVEAMGFRLPDDLATLFGSSLTLAVDGKGLRGPVPEMGLRSVTDPEEANRILDQVEALVGPGFGQVVTRKTLPDGVVVATSPRYADELAAEGELGSEPGYADALPGVDASDMAVWVSIRQLEPVIAPEVTDPTGRDVLAALDAVGMTMTADGKGSATYTFRVVTR